jgi:TM2 domain-containing membrane protein YozV
MYCTNCGKEVSAEAVACTNCGLPPRLKRNFCYACGVEINPEQVMCIKCGVSLDGAGTSGAPPARPLGKQPVTAALLAIFLGAFGAHKFYHGSTGWGVIYLLLCWTWLSFLAGIIEGIVYLTMDHAAYDQKYNQEAKDPWKW